VSIQRLEPIGRYWNRRQSQYCPGSTSSPFKVAESWRMLVAANVVTTGTPGGGPSSRSDCRIIGSRGLAKEKVENNRIPITKRRPPNPRQRGDPDEKVKVYELINYLQGRFY